MANKWFAELNKLGETLKKDVNIHARVLRTPSPSVNFIFGNAHGLPRGYSMLLWGPPGGGKSLLANSMIGQTHRDDPEALVVKFDAEMRDAGQLRPVADTFGVDLDRYVVYQENTPESIFDRIKYKIGPMCERGAPISLIVVDSINAVQGKREAEAESVTQHIIGDHAKTMQDGLKMIAPIQRKYGISLVLIAQQRSELDMWEQKRGNKTKAAVSHGVQHHCEYFVYAERNKTKAGQTDELGNTFEDASRKDVTDSAETTGHKVRVWMQKSSFGGAGRTGEFTLDYKLGVVNQHEEVFRLGTKWGIIGRPSTAYFELGGQKYNGKAACLEALKNDPKLQALVIQGLLAAEKEQRIAHVPTSTDADDAATIEKAFADAEDGDEESVETVAKKKGR